MRNNKAHGQSAHQSEVWPLPHPQLEKGKPEGTEGILKILCHLLHFTKGINKGEGKGSA
jgi:hypothetical protein